MERDRGQLEAAAKAAALKLGYPGLKSEQLSVVVEFLSGSLLDLARLSAMEFFLLLLMS